ncbi:hypothetical protein DL96DRAFT_1654493 [Flagelloscypha sp. PMI_526]|nr:hypothetical protein DL96DRAFT_1654493 [Flagelloscypha sp. PMI_526]
MSHPPVVSIPLNNIEDDVRDELLPPRPSKSIGRLHRIKQAIFQSSNPTFKSLLIVVKFSWINLLFIFVPSALVVHFLGLDAKIRLSFLFVSLIPVAKMIGFLIMEISSRFKSENAQVFLRCTGGNIIELVSGIVAIRACQIEMLKATLVGSMLVNTLFVLGVAGIVAGLKFMEANFQVTGTLVHGLLLVLSSVITLIPTILYYGLTSTTLQNVTVEDGRRAILLVSRAVPFSLLIIYVCWCLFQLRSHRLLYDVEGEEEREEEEQALPQISLAMTLCLATIMIGILVVLTEYFVSAVIDLSAVQGQPTPQWIGFILIPLVSTLARQDVFEASESAGKGHFTLVIGMTLEAAVHMAHLVLPLLVIVGWIVGKDVSLLFNVFQATCLFFAGIIVYMIVADGKVNYMETCSALVLYFVICFAYFFFPKGTVDQYKPLCL